MLSAVIFKAPSFAPAGTSSTGGVWVRGWTAGVRVLLKGKGPLDTKTAAALAPFRHGWLGTSCAPRPVRHIAHG